MDIAAKNRRLAKWVVCAVLFMIGLSFASVPLYTLFCRVTGYDGTTQVGEKLPDTISERKITIAFEAQVDRALPWDFKPEKRQVTVNIGQQGLISYTARNLSAQKTVGTALYNVTPDKAGKYFFKTQCFCFAEQLLEGGKEAHFPVIFYVDPKILEDRNMDDVSDIALSYTFFPANSKKFDAALEKYAQQKMNEDK